MEYMPAMVYGENWLMIRKKAPKGTIVIKNSERQRCEIWSRVMGYYRPVSEYNIGKQSEFRERIPFSEEKAKQIMEWSAFAKASADKHKG